LQASCLKTELIITQRSKPFIKTKTKNTNKKTTQEGDAIIDYFANKLKELGGKVQEDNWTQQNQLYCILKMYLTYGVLRPSERLDLKLWKLIVKTTMIIFQQSKMLSIITKTTEKVKTILILMMMNK
jgi:hypothetical protein